MSQMEIPELEAHLTAAYAQQTQLYAEFLQLAETLAKGFHADDAGEQTLRRMNAIMETIHQIDSAATHWRETWQSKGVSAGPPLAATLKQVESLIVNVMDCLANAEHDAIAAKERLYPQLSGQSKRLQMAKAYRDASDT